MNLNEVFSNEYTKVEADPQKEYIQLTWLQHVSGDPLRKSLEKSLRYAYEEGIRLWLFDMRNSSYTTLADQNWTVSTFFPAFDQTKRHRLACLIPIDRVELLPDNVLQDAIRENFELREHFELQLFTDTDTAKLWLFL